MKKKTYNIDKNYIINKDSGHHDDTPYTEEGQKEVYLYAKVIMENNNFKKVSDVGCGSAYKLIKYLGGYETVGYEVEPVLSKLKDKYPDRLWIDSGVPEKTFDGKIFDCDLVICADVIEHIIDPDILLNYLKQFKTKYLIISTPCRFVLCNDKKLSSYYKHSFNGPPVNGAHVREWTFDEFKKYLSKHFNIIESHKGVEQVELQYHLLKLKND